MALPTKTALLELDTSWRGAPFCRVEAKAMQTTELDFSWLGSPFVAVAPAVAASKFKRWNGSTWESKSLKVWTGSAFVAKPLKRWNGSSWEVIAS